MLPSITKRNRRLLNQDEVFTQNAWDDTEWTEEMVKEAEERIQKQRIEAQDLTTDIESVEPRVVEKWDEFYRTHGDKFFKDRKWIFSEFPEILPHLEEGNTKPCRILEVGCGVGNAVANIIEINHNPNLIVFCCDLSPSAIETLKGREFYRNNDIIDAFTADIFKDFEGSISTRIERESLDFITMIFTLSALNPDQMLVTVANLSQLLKPNGMILFRDYAQYDLTQLRFKGKSYLRDNYYVRADGTTSYFFSKDFVAELFSRAGLQVIELKEDNRMLVNRLKSLKMCRRWIQAKYSRISSI